MRIKDHSHLDFIEEEKNLQKLENTISASITGLSSEIADNMKQLKKEKDPVVIRQLNNEILQYRKDTILYERRRPNPYYARMSFQIGDKEETYAIGWEGLNDYRQKSNIIVVDWRAEIGKTYSQKSVNEFEIDGKKYKVTLRRGVNIEDGGLVSINNEYVSKSSSAGPVVSQPETVTAVSPQPDNIVDPFLLELLLDQRRINAVTDIIATIQEKQHEIIFQPYNVNFAVQGCSGSGKTMILLHRLSYLLYNGLKDKISINNIRIITPNNDFRYCINDLVHQLELDSIPIMTIDELYKDLIKRVTTGLAADKAVLPDTKLSSEFINQVYSAEFLQRIEEKYVNHWKSVIDSLKEIKTDGLSLRPEKYNYSGFQALSVEIGKISSVISKLNQEVERARINYVNSGRTVREGVMSKLEQIPKRIKENNGTIERLRLIIAGNKNNYEKALARRKDMDAYQDYQRYKDNPKTATAVFLYGKIPEIIDQIQTAEKEVEKIPFYAFLKRNRLVNNLEEWKKEYREQARAVFKPFYDQLDNFHADNEKMENEISVLQQETSELAETEEVLRRLRKAIAFSFDIEMLKKESEYEKWLPFLRPYFDAKNTYEHAVRTRNEDPEYQSIDKLRQKLSQLNPESVFENVYRSSYRNDVAEKCGSNEQFHFELFLKLHFCIRYFGRTQFRMFLNIDEGQTLFTSEYHTLQNFLDAESIMNVYGDVNQKIDDTFGISFWHEISDQWKIFVLNENYRNTKQITEFCNAEFSAGLIPIGIEGPDVQILNLAQSVEWIKNRYKTNPQERFAIIWDGDPKRKEVLSRTIWNLHNFYWNYSDKKGIFILTAEMARGLEFENVLVWDYQMTFGEKYISYTRSLNNLIIARNNFFPTNIAGIHEDVSNMLTMEQFLHRVSVQSETIERYIRDGKLIPDLVVTNNGNRKQYYFKEETLAAAIKKFGWQKIDDKNRKELFMKMVQDMNMSASYKPVLLKGFFEYADKDGRCKMLHLVRYFRAYYEDRRKRNLTVERKDSLFSNKLYSPNDIERLILNMPYKRFEEMGMMHYNKPLKIIEMEKTVWKSLKEKDKNEILRLCDDALDRYYQRLAK